MSKFKVLLVYPNCMMATLLPLSIASLSACLKEVDIDVKLFDTTFYKTEEISFEKKKELLLQVKPFENTMPFKETDIYEDFKKVVEEYNPQVIGLSLVEDTIDLGLSLLENINTKYKVVIAGGVGVNYNWKSIIVHKKVDCVCIGEGERSFIEFCLQLREKGRYINKDIKGIIWKNREGDFIGNPKDLYYPVDINALPYPDFSIFEENRIKRVMHGKTYRMLHVELDRGCVFSCNYCCAPTIKKMYKKGTYYRQKNVNRIIEELVYLKEKYNPDYIDLNSETFLARSEEDIKKFSIWYKRLINIPFWCQSRPETITSDKIYYLKMAGLADFQLGIEHGNEDFRSTYLNRKGSNEQIIRACNVLKGFNVPYTVNCIIGFPDETRELVFDTINLCKLIDPKTINVYMMAPYKGTWFYDYCKEEKLIDIGMKTNQLLDGADIKYKYLTKKEFLGLQRTFPFYVRFNKDMKLVIEKAEKFNEEGDKMFNSLRKLYIEMYYK